MTVTEPGLGLPVPTEMAPIAPDNRRRQLSTVGLYVVSIAVALLLTAVLVRVVGGSPISVLSAFYRGSIGSGSAAAGTIGATVPVLVVALGTVVGVRAGMFNIGQTGQLLMGATFGAAVALKLPVGGPLLLILTLLASAVGGAVWAAIPAILHAKRNINVVISTLLLVYVADELISWLVSSPSLLQEPTNRTLGESGSLPQSALIPSAARLPFFGQGGFLFSTGAFIAGILLIVLAVLLRRSRWGVRLRMVGENQVAARRFGVRAVSVAGWALVISGAFAGLAGGLLLSGGQYRIQAGFDDNFANDGLLAALVARDNPVALLVVSFFFGVIRTGGNYLVSTGVPSYLYQVLEGLLVLAAVFPPAYRARRELRTKAMSKIRSVKR